MFRVITGLALPLVRGGYAWRSRLAVQSPAGVWDELTLVTHQSFGDDGRHREAV